MSDYGLKISAPGFDARTAAASNLLLNMQYPIAKLDSTNGVSFRDVTLTFVNDPPEPALDTSNSTTVYSFAHGYSYVPQMWSMITMITPPASRTILEAYNQDYMTLAEVTPADIAVLYVRADANNIMYIVDKTRSSLPGNGPNPLAPCVIKVRTYVFVQDITS